MKLREFLKTLILTLLVISSVILASKIWFSEELWSDGYNSFRYDSFVVSKIFSVFKKEPKVKPLEYNQIFFPKQLMVTGGGNTALVTPTDDEYLPLSEEIKQILNKMFEGFSVSETDNGEFRRACKASSVFVDFYNNTSFKMLGDYFGVENSAETEEINNIRQLLISLDEAAIYARNNQSGKIYKLTFKGDMKTLKKTAEQASEGTGDGVKMYSYAFENGFDLLPEDSDGPVRMLLDPYIIINIGMADIPVTEAVPLIKERNGDTYSRLLEVFDMKINTSRYFSENDGTANYIENYSKLRISKNGYLEYASMSEEKGIELGAGISSDYDIIKASGEFLEKINSIFPLPEGNGYVFNRLTKDGNKSRVYFDITYNGIPVILSGFGNMRSSVEITVDGTKITSYNQLFTAFRQSGGNMEIKNVITALDEFYSVYGTESAKDVKITDMYSTYSYSKNNKAIGVKWIVSLSNNEHVVVEGN